MSAPASILPEPEELHRQRTTKRADGTYPTLQEIGDRYGVSRQAVQQRIKKWRARAERAEEDV